MGIPSRHPEHEEEEEYDDALFYEDIQAPKFVDLTAPDAGRPTDDASWFCLRFGCDQNHEQVDPEALDRSFFMRVMAARSPNVRLHKAIRRKNQSSMLKCPHSAPPKPPRARFARLSAGTEAAPRSKPRTQQISALRASPPRAKAARIQPSSARKKALTTPRSNAIQPRQDPFLSVKHQKQPVAAAERKGTVVKALFTSTPKKETARTPVPAKAKAAVSEVCSKLKKLNLACREVPSRYMLSNPKTVMKDEETVVTKSARKGQESRPNGNKKILGRSVKCSDAEADERNRNGCDKSAAGDNSPEETANFNKAVLQEVRIEVDTLQSDDNKENLVNAEQPYEVPSHYEVENRVLENNENVPVKVATVQNKLNPEQGGKLKTTNPKPFRLRTDERRVLKDANPERKQPFAENNSRTVLKPISKCPAAKGRDKPICSEKQERRVLKDANPERKQPFAENNSMAVLKPINKCPAAKGRDKPICSEKPRKQTTQIVTPQLGEAKQAMNSIRCKSTKPAAMTKTKAVEKPQRVSRVASTTRTTKASSRLAAPETRKERKPSVKMSRTQVAAA